MLKNVRLIMLYYQSMHNKNFEEKRQQRKHLSNPSPYLFFANFLVESYCLDHLLFQQAFFVKTFFFIIFNMAFFLSTPFIPDMSVFFFVNFQLPKNILFFFEENE